MNFKILVFTFALVANLAMGTEIQETEDLNRELNPKFVRKIFDLDIFGGIDLANGDSRENGWRGGNGGGYGGRYGGNRGGGYGGYQGGGYGGNQGGYGEDRWRYTNERRFGFPGW